MKLRAEEDTPVEQPAACGGCNETSSGAADHDFGGFDEGDGGITGFESEFAGAIGGDDGCDALVADGKDDLGEEAVDNDLCDGAEELVTAADSSRARMGL